MIDLTKRLAIPLGIMAGAMIFVSSAYAAPNKPGWDTNLNVAQLGPAGLSTNIDTKLTLIENRLVNKLENRLDGNILDRTVAMIHELFDNLRAKF